MKIIAPSILSADFNQLGKDIEMLNQSKAGWIHVDVMDGIFVPNISIGIPVIKSIKKIATKPLDVHLMIVEPDRYIQEFVNAGASCLSIHYEVSHHLHRSLHKIKELNAKAGVVLNPHTPVHVLSDIICECDFVLLMSVNPGFGGQKFIQSSIAKASELKNLIIQKNAVTLIEMDGGIDKSNIENLSKAGVDIFVAGNSVFASQNPQKTIEELDLMAQV